MTHKISCKFWDILMNATAGWKQIQIRRPSSSHFSSRCINKVSRRQPTLTKETESAESQEGTNAAACNASQWLRIQSPRKIRKYSANQTAWHSLGRTRTLMCQIRDTNFQNRKFLPSTRCQCLSDNHRRHVRNASDLKTWMTLRPTLRDSWSLKWTPISHFPTAQRRDGTPPCQSAI